MANLCLHQFFGWKYPLRNSTHSSSCPTPEALLSSEDLLPLSSDNHKITSSKMLQEEEQEDDAEAAALLSELPLPPPSDDNEDDDPEEETTRRRRRSICYNGCGRPSTVCLCPYLPPHPIRTSTEIIVLHHPHSLTPASTNTLSTLPPLTSSLLNLHLLRGRALRLGSHPLLDSLFHHHSPLHSRPALFLFPSLLASPSPIPLSRWAHRTPLAARADPVLIVFDGTWAQAREMVAASLSFLMKFATHVSLGQGVDEGPSSYESELVVRKEPFEGCVSTMEAVARALRVVEPEEGVGVEVEERLIGVLKAMVGFQARHLKEPMKPRIKMRKKKEMRKMEEDKGLD